MKWKKNQKYNYIKNTRIEGKVYEMQILWNTVIG